MRYEKPVLLFDGECGLCNHWVQFVIQKDPKGKLLIASLQSDVGKYFLEKFGITKVGHDTFLLVEGDKYYTQSTASLRVAKRLKGLWPLFYGLIIIPRFIRDAVYDWVAKNRNKWYGRTETCTYPTEEMRNRFIDERMS